MQKILFGAIQSQSFPAASESVFCPQLSSLSEPRSHRSSFPPWSLKDFDFQKEDEKDGFEGVKCRESGFCSDFATWNNLIAKSRARTASNLKMKSIFSFLLESSSTYTRGSWNAEGSYPDQLKDAAF